MKIQVLLLLQFTVVSLSRAATIVSTFDNGGGDNQWNTAANWNPDGVPNNNVTDQFEVTLPASLASSVVLDINATVDSLAIGASTTLSNLNAQTLTLAGDLTNDGLIEVAGISSFSRLVLDHPTSAPVTFSGSGILRFTGGAQNLDGTAGQVLINGSNHTIEGFTSSNSVGLNRLNIQNQGAISANVSGEKLRIDPELTFENTGSVAATNGGILEFLSGNYSGNGVYQVGDNSELETSGANLNGVTFSADDQDFDPSNNIVRNTGGVSFTGVTLESGLTATNNGAETFTIAGDVTNNALIELVGTSSSSRLFVDHPSDLPITLGGSGILRFTGGAQNLAGDDDQLLINGSDHTIEGFLPNNSLGFNDLNIQNEGTITANVAGEALRIDPISTFENSGTVSATNGGVLTLLSGTFSGSGIYEVGDNSELQLAGAALENLTIAADDQDIDPANNTVRLTSSSNMAGVTFGPGLTVTNNGSQAFNLADDITNNALIELSGVNSTSRLSVDHPSGDPITLGGSGTLRFTGGSQLATGPANQLLINGPGHTIDGSTTNLSVGLNNLDIRNEGMIVANVLGEILRIDARTTFENFGTLAAEGGATLEIRLVPTFESHGIMRVTGGSTILFNPGEYQGTGLLEISVGSEFDAKFSDFTHAGDALIDGELSVLNGSITGGKLSGDGSIFLAPTTTVLFLEGAVLSPGSEASPIGSLFIGATGAAPGQSVPVNGNTIEIDLQSETVHDEINFSFASAGDSGFVGQQTGTNELQISLKGPASGFTGAPIPILNSVAGPVTLGNGSNVVRGGFKGFTNVSFGDRLTTTDGLASFEVDGQVTEEGPGSNIFNGSDVALINPLFAPEWDAEPYAFTIPAGSLLGAAVGTVSATDPESDPVTYSIVSGPFDIDSTTGAITVADAGAVASDTGFNIAVTASDADLSNTTIVTITVGSATPDTNESCVRELLTQAGGAFPGQTDPAVIGFNADPDKDGIGNVFELWLGLDPAVSDGPPVIKIFPTGNAPNVTAALDVTVDPAVDDLLDVDGTFSFDLTGSFRVGTRLVLSENANTRELRFLDTLSGVNGIASGRLEVDPSAVKSN